MAIRCEGAASRAGSAQLKSQALVISRQRIGNQKQQKRMRSVASEIALAFIAM
jgi:hypothetical protein